MSVDAYKVRALKTMTIKVTIDIIKFAIGNNNISQPMTDINYIDDEETKKQTEFEVEFERDEELKIESESKWLKYPSESFIWTITDQIILYWIL